MDNMAIVRGCDVDDPFIFHPQSDLVKTINHFAETSLPILVYLLLIILIISIALELFNLFILTRPSMQKMSTIRELQIMMSSAFLMSISGFIQYFALLLLKNTCAGKYSLLYRYIREIQSFLFTITHQMITWSVVYITLQRVNVLIVNQYGKKHRINIHAFTWFSGFCIFAVFLNQVIRTAAHEFLLIDDAEEISTISAPGCTGAQLYKTINKPFGCSMGSLRYLMINVFGEILPCVILLVSTCFLVSQVNTMDSKRAVFVAPTQSKMNRTKSVIIFLVFFFLSEIPLSLLYGIGILSLSDFRIIYDATYPHQDFIIYVTIIICIMIYCLTSSVYRTTVSSIFRLGSDVKILEAVSHRSTA